MGYLDDDDFRAWVLNRGKSLTAREMVEDDHFSCRLLSDVLYGRSKSFNKTGSAGGLEFLYEEYKKEMMDSAEDGL